MSHWTQVFLVGATWEQYIGEPSPTAATPRVRPSRLPRILRPPRAAPLRR